MADKQLWRGWWAKLRADRASLTLLAVTTLAMAALAAWLLLSYNNLPDLMPLHFDAQGNADRIAERREILLLPLIGAVVYLFNVGVGLFLRLRHRMVFAANLMWGGALIVQVLLALAAWNIVH